jgi:hypothetical protein
MSKLEGGTIVFFDEGDNEKYDYKIMNNEPKDLDDYYFGVDDSDTKLTPVNLLVDFDYVLSEVTKDGKFVKNIACFEDNIIKR